MQETDLILMSLVIFVPALFALGIILFPRGKDEAVRWWSLAGTALTLGLSLCAFISFRYDTIDQAGPDARKQAQLDTRVRKLDELEKTRGAARTGCRPIPGSIRSRFTTSSALTASAWPSCY